MLLPSPRLLRGVDLFPAPGSSSSVLQDKRFLVRVFMSGLTFVCCSDSDSEMETRLKEAAVSIKDLLPSSAVLTSSEYGQIKENVVEKKKKKKKRTQECSDDANGHPEKDVQVKVKRKKKRQGAKEEAINWTFSNLCSLWDVSVVMETVFPHKWMRWGKSCFFLFFFNAWQFNVIFGKHENFNKKVEESECAKTQQKWAD